MSLNVGDRLGHDDVTALIGEGGHGPGLRREGYEAQLRAQLTKMVA